MPEPTFSRLTPTQPTATEIQPDFSTSAVISQKTPRSTKKRKTESSVNDEFTQAIIQSLNQPEKSTVLGQAVSDLENQLDKRNQRRLKLKLKQKINNLLSEIEDESLKLLDE